jgi:hypothetical protein
MKELKKEETTEDNLCFWKEITKETAIWKLGIHISTFKY